MDTQDLITAHGLAAHPAGAHLVSAGTPGGELLFVSSVTGCGAGTPIRGGVPLIAPWFGTLLGEEPAHGFARRVDWECRVTGTGLAAVLDRDDWHLTFSADPTPNGIFVELSARNDAPGTRPVQLAFHPYFGVGDIDDCTVTGLDGEAVLDRVTGADGRVGGAITFNGLVDRIITAPAGRTATLTDGTRTVDVTGRGTDSVIVWNPGAENAAGMRDLGEGEWRRFVCVEPALLGPDLAGVPVVPGETVTIGMTAQLTVPELG
ncbi:D-hexose-6-phosphate mutarotase [Corynebacterium pygosceleis]|uniref:D-hexose-6-phosphate mutarotase n=1 Tax=Corynebacterium pygosceleis TaxID=2800406 RepID=A0A9Q4CBZ6_9CORY|nr:D-hexose-6-phosphate mutarotase [Corynebacterium pygosceleis]MCK7636486.1 D-hexose-6-phosphate mutarotase [Corynebacterium pygosceleis]MCK7675060.1 D-hexose-6-phosphate mutarotase [Corynebacterium pygosceleis]MCL0121471.1 D-hexose-6-phosphate mutarotase [Corynebacterium pygosceleis]MCX7469200.1 D-hexose-6-phosphate mutarotase [Corynebacterium pygosceleis]